MVMTVSVHLKDKPADEIEVKSMSSAEEVLQQLKPKRLDRVVAVKVNGEARDLSSPIDSRAEVEPVYMDSEEGLGILRHSTSHVMAMAVKELFPGVKVTIGPSIEDGFYYDFDYKRPFKEEDLPKIEEKMDEIIKADLNLNLLRFGQDSHGSRRGMDAPSSFSNRNTLHPMHPTLIFQLAIGSLALDFEDDLFKATDAGFIA